MIKVNTVCSSLSSKYLFRVNTVLYRRLLVASEDPNQITQMLYWSGAMLLEIGHSSKREHSSLSSKYLFRVNTVLYRRPLVASEDPNQITQMLYWSGALLLLENGYSSKREHSKLKVLPPFSKGGHSNIKMFFHFSVNLSEMGLLLKKRICSRRCS